MLIRDPVRGCIWLSQPKVRQGGQEEGVELGEADHCRASSQLQPNLCFHIPAFYSPSYHLNSWYQIVKQFIHDNVFHPLDRSFPWETEYCLEYVFLPVYLFYPLRNLPTHSNQILASTQLEASQKEGTYGGMQPGLREDKWRQQEMCLTCKVLTFYSAAGSHWGKPVSTNLKQV